MGEQDAAREGDARTEMESEPVECHFLALFRFDWALSVSGGCDLLGEEGVPRDRNPAQGTNGLSDICALSLKSFKRAACVDGGGGWRRMRWKTFEAWATYPSDFIYRGGTVANEQDLKRMC